MSEVHEIKFFKKDGELFAALFAEPSIFFPEFWIKNVKAKKLGFSKLPNDVKLQCKYKVTELGLKPFESNKEGLAFGVSDFVYRLTKGSSKGDQTYITNNIMNNYEQTGNFGVGHMSGGNINDGTKVAGVINEAEQQNLAQAAEEIQALLEQLEQTYPAETLSQKALMAEKVIKQIEDNPTFKEKVVRAIKAMGIEALMEAINHPVANVLRVGIETFREPNDNLP